MKWAIGCLLMVPRRRSFCASDGEGERIGTVDTVIIDGDGNDTEPFTDDEDDKNEDRD